MLCGIIREFSGLQDFFLKAFLNLQIKFANLKKKGKDQVIIDGFSFAGSGTFPNKTPPAKNTGTPRIKIPNGNPIVVSIKLTIIISSPTAAKQHPAVSEFSDIFIILPRNFSRFSGS
jgi:hypothetical protein